MLMIGQQSRLHLIFHEASLCFGRTKTLLYKVKHPAGLIKSKQNRHEDNKKSKP
jgi:hypothetical protein